MRKLTTIAMMCGALGCAEDKETMSSDCRTDEAVCTAGYACQMLQGGIFGCVLEMSAADVEPIQVSDAEIPVDSTTVDAESEYEADASTMNTDAEIETMNPYVKVAAGGYHTCAIKHNGELYCWGRNNYGQTDVVEGRYLDVSTNYWHTCAVTDEGNITCWGDNEFEQALPRSGDFVAVAAGYMHTCGLLQNGEVECWGLDDARIIAPEGPFISIDAGWYHTCGVRMDQSAV